MPGARWEHAYRQGFFNIFCHFRRNRFFTGTSKPFIFMSPTRGFVYPYSKTNIFSKIKFSIFMANVQRTILCHTGLQPINTGLIHAKLSFCQCPKVYSMSNRPSTNDQRAILCRIGLQPVPKGLCNE